MGVSLLIFFVAINLTLGLVSIALAHIAFCIGFVAIVVRARLAGMDESLIEAARDLGRDPTAGVPAGNAAADHARCHRRRADGVYAFYRRFRHHLFHRRRRAHDAAAQDLHHGQDLGHAGGERRVDSADAGDPGADRDRIAIVAGASCGG